MIVGFFILTKLLAYTFLFENISPSLSFIIQNVLISKDLHWENSSLFREIGRHKCSPRELEYKHYLVLLLLLLLLLLFIILYRAPQSKNKKEKKSHYLLCRNSLPNNGNITVLNRALMWTTSFKTVSSITLFGETK